MIMIISIGIKVCKISKIKCKAQLEIFKTSVKCQHECVQYGYGITAITFEVSVPTRIAMANSYPKGG